MLTMFMTSTIIVGLFYVLSSILDKPTDFGFGSLTHTSILKGLGVFLVVINHIGAQSGYRYFQPLGGIGVSLFLICSGHGMMKSFQSKGFDHFFRKKITKVLVPFWIVYLSYITFTQPSLELMTVLKGMLLVVSFGIFWFVQYLFLFYMFFFVGFSFFRERSGIIFLLVISSLLFLTSSTLLLGEQSFAFVVGVILAQLKVRFDKHRQFLLSVLFLLISLLSLLLKQTEWVREGTNLLLNLNGVLIKTGGALGILFLVSAMSELKFLKIFLLPGTVSLEIYLVHVTLTDTLLSEFTMLNVLLLLVLSCLGVVSLQIITKKLTSTIGLVLRKCHHKSPLMEIVNSKHFDL